MPFDRDLLLLGSKRNQVLSLDEIHQYGIDSYQDPDYVSIYGLRPAQAHAMGIRMLGRTAVECTRDDLAAAIAAEVARVADLGAAPARLVLDPFAGSGNTVYWLLQRLAGARAFACENDPQVYELSSRNLSLLGLPLQLECADFPRGLDKVAAQPGELVVVFVAPPWGRALDANAGLDLSRTEPPVLDIVDCCVRRFEGHPMLFAIQIHEIVEGQSLARLTSRFDAHERKVYALNRPGQNHGVLIGCVGWTPRADHL